MFGHPFNPPHLIPLVEVAGGREAAPERRWIARSILPTRSVNSPSGCAKKCADMSQTGYRRRSGRKRSTWSQLGWPSVADVDAAIAHGPRPSLGLARPLPQPASLRRRRGIGALFEKPLWEATKDMWRDLGVAHVTEPLKQQVVTGTDQELAHADLEKLVRQRDEILVQLLQLKAASRLP